MAFQVAKAQFKDKPIPPRERSYEHMVFGDLEEIVRRDRQKEKAPKIDAVFTWSSNVFMIGSGITIENYSFLISTGTVLKNFNTAKIKNPYGIDTLKYKPNGISADTNSAANVVNLSALYHKKFELFGGNFDVGAGFELYLYMTNKQEKTIDSVIYVHKSQFDTPTIGNFNQDIDLFNQNKDYRAVKVAPFERSRSVLDHVYTFVAPTVSVSISPSFYAKSSIQFKTSMMMSLGERGSGKIPLSMIYSVSFVFHPFN
jgi:hypothetical protein